jgi:hypothetical protein
LHLLALHLLALHLLSLPLLALHLLALNLLALHLSGLYGSLQMPQLLRRGKLRLRRFDLAPIQRSACILDDVPDEGGE